MIYIEIYIVSVACLFTLLTVSLGEQFLIVIEFRLSFWYFIDPGFGIISKKSLPNSKSQ